MALTWKAIDEFPNYEVCENGDVRNKNTKHTLKCKNDKGYLRVALYNDANKKYKCVHRLVAETFYSSPNDVREVNHRNGYKHVNSIDNLEFCSRSENMKHAYRMGLKTPSGGLPEKAVFVAETGETYRSAYECARILNCDQAHINHCLTGKRKSHKGYHFEYADAVDGGI